MAILGPRTTGNTCTSLYSCAQHLGHYCMKVQPSSHAVSCGQVVMSLSGTGLRLYAGFKKLFWVAINVKLICEEVCAAIHAGSPCRGPPGGGRGDSSSLPSSSTLDPLPCSRSSSARTGLAVQQAMQRSCYGISCAATLDHLQAAYTTCMLLSGATRWQCRQ